MNRKWLRLRFILIMALCIGFYVARMSHVPVGLRPQTYPMPSVAEVMANIPVRSPVFTRIYDSHQSLCMTTNWIDLMSMQYETYTGNNFYMASMPEGQAFEQRFRETAQFAVDGRDQLALYWVPPLNNLLYYPLQEVCTNVSSLAPGRYVAQFSFETPPGDTYSYTWVFERTADGVIPEVRN